MSIERRCDGCGITAAVEETKGWLRALSLDGGWSFEFHDENCCALHIESLADLAASQAASQSS